MTLEEMRALPGKLRAVKSRSKGKLLEEAAEAIETLQTELAAAVAALKELDTDCLVCDHNHREAPCEGTDYLCNDCPYECPCKGCKDNSKWAWRGRCGDAVT